MVFQRVALLTIPRKGFCLPCRFYALKGVPAAAAVFVVKQDVQISCLTGRKLSDYLYSLSNGESHSLSMNREFKI